MTTPTDPLDGLVLPYSVTMTPIADSYNLTNDAPLDLPMGVLLVRLTWDGPEAFRYRLDRTVNGNTVSTPWNIIIPSAVAGAPRSSPPIELAINTPSRIVCQGSVAFSQKTVTNGHRAGMTVIPMGAPAT